MKKEEFIKIIEERFISIGGSDTVDTYVSINKYEDMRIIECHSDLGITANLTCFKVSKINIGKKTNFVHFISNDNKVLNVLDMENLDLVNFIDGIDECIADVEMPTEDCDLGLIDEEDLSEEYTPRNEEYTPDKPASKFNKDNGCIKESCSNDNINYIRRKYEKYHNNIITENYYKIQLNYWEMIYCSRIWISKDGTKRYFGELDTDHIKNIIYMLYEFEELDLGLTEKFKKIEFELTRELIQRKEL